MPKKKVFFLLAGIVFLTYFNSLSNGFIQDDALLFAGNDFYKNPANLPRLVSGNFITTLSELENPLLPSQARSISGCVSYRPVTALSFFADCFIWRMNPFGFHLTNILLHILAAFLIYDLCLAVIKNRNIALLSALLFAVHPIHADLINNIGFRSDLLAAVFYLIAFRGLISLKPVRANIWKISALAGCFLLALLSKETAATLPFVFFAFDVIFSDDPHPVRVFLRRRGVYAGILATLVFYLWIYFFVFPNAHLARFAQWHPSGQLLVSTKIFFHYLCVLVFPFKVSMLASFYTPALASVKVFEVLAVLSFLIVCCFLVCRLRKIQKVAAFFIVWFLLTYLPTSGIFPLPTPFAYRFMYLPSIGFFVVCAIMIENILAVLSKKRGGRFTALLIRVVMIGLGISVTLPFNEYYQNDISIYTKVINDQPGSSYPYLFLGTLYRQMGAGEKAAGFFEQYLKNKPRDGAFAFVRPDYEVRHQIGTCFPDDPDRAIDEFQKAIALNPDFAVAYADLGRAYMHKKDYDRAWKFVRQALEMDPGLFPAYVYAVEIQMVRNEPEDARRLIEKAAGLFPQEERLWNNFQKKVNSMGP